MEFNDEYFPVILSGHLRHEDIPGKTKPPWRLRPEAIKDFYMLIGGRPKGDFTYFALVKTNDVITVVTLCPTADRKGIDVVPVDAEKFLR
jgi:hypothetical protein